MTESEEQKQLIQWCRTDPRFQYLFHIPNESVGGQGWLIRNRQLGVRAGVPDLFYPVPMGSYHGLFIEMKAKNGRLRPEQKRWIKALEQLGYKCIVAHGWEEAREALEKYVSTNTRHHQTPGREGRARNKYQLLAGEPPEDGRGPDRDRDTAGRSSARNE